MKNSVGKTIKKAIFDSGLSHKKVASLLGVTPASISLWENGRTFPSENNVKNINKLFGTSINIHSSNRQPDNAKYESIETDGIIQKQINISEIALTINVARHIYNRSHSIKMRQQDLAKNVGLMPQAFSKRIIGKVPWKISELQKVAKILNLKSYFLIFGPINENNVPKISLSRIVKSSDSSGNTIYLVTESKSEEKSMEYSDSNNKNSIEKENNEFKMFMKFRKFMEAQNDND